MKGFQVINKKLSQQRKLNRNKCISLGPVDNLEQYVPLDWWKRIFNSLYLKTDGDVVNDYQITSQEVTIFSEILDLQSNDFVLDLCCGQGRHSLELTRRGFKNVYGLDKSSFLIHKAKTSAKKDNLSINFKEGDARKLPYSTDKFDVVMILGNSFGYFESIKDDLRVLKEIYRVLKPGGKLFLDLADGEFLKKEYTPRSWEWVDSKYFVCRERSLSLDKERLISREIITDVERGVIADQFYAERLYNRQKIKELLNIAGFSNIIIHGEITPNSLRNQDLGMMQRRILVSAIIEKEWRKATQKIKPQIRNIIVILGDPEKSDITKPSSTFDDDDFYTINQLKISLMELDGYNFIYLDNHERLIWDLTNINEKIDYIFNLCDEGYFNDARNELYIPALLEMLRIAYSGASPQCLAFCYDKSLIRGIAKEMGIPVANGTYITQEEIKFDLPFDFPIIVKPNFGDSSFGITQKSVAKNSEDLINAINEIRQKFGYNNPILIEEFLTGNDISVGIIGNPPNEYQILPIIEEDYSTLPEYLPKICGYEAKWLSDSPYSKITSIPARIDEETKGFIIDSCLKLFKRLECRDYCRFDWRFDAQGIPKLLEVNPNPGWCWDGHLAKMAKFEGLSYKEMLHAILQTVEKRIGLQPLNGI